MTARSWMLEYNERPWLANAARGMNHFVEAKLVTEWRTAFGWLAASQKIPKLEACTIEAIHLRKDRRSMPDVGACAPACKAAVDALVDAGVLVDDSPEYVTAITYRVSVEGVDGLRLIIKEQTKAEEA